MDLKEVHDRVTDQLDKELVGYVSHEEIDLALDRAQMAEFFDLFGNYQEYAPGRPQARKSYGVTSIVKSGLAPFVKPYDVVFTASEASLPSGIEVITSAETAGGTTVDIINENQVTERLRSQIVAPSTSKPVLYQADKLYLLPDDQDVTIKVWGLTRPSKPVFSYTLSGRTLTYSSGTSTQLEWKDIETERIINRAVSLLATKIQDQGNTQYAEMKTDKGL